MTDKAEQVLSQALELSEEDRADLAARLLLSLEADTPSETERAWEQEIARRVREIDDGSIKMIPWGDVRQELLGD